MRPRPTPRRAHRAHRGAALLLAAALAAGAGCARFEGAHSDGPAERVDPPRPLWPEATPAPPEGDRHPSQDAPVPGVPKVPSGDMRDADALAVVKADVRAQSRQDGRSGRLVDAGAAERLATCGTRDCPVRPPAYYDLTENGKHELIAAVDTGGRHTELRVYTVKDQVVTRVLAVRAALVGVEVAAGHLTTREPTTDPRYVSASDYLWDGRTMVLESMVLDERRPPPTPPPSPERP
ncbi:hypothetical protein [Streptomyces sp. URMC 123]|uniref:hypothetical protein n=1 Tax=Streptomyces sp. URMC 123 TaxID=3423403 RepID=UPI003F1AB8B4